jgi:hypothetical protein
MSDRLIIATTAEDISMAALYATNSRKRYTLVTKEELKDCAECFHSFIDTVYLDASKVKKVFKSPLIHDGKIVNTIFSQLHKYTEHCEEVVNISQDRLSCLITSYINPKTYTGSKVNSFNDIIYKSKVDTYLAAAGDNDLYLNKIEGVLFSSNINYTTKPILNSDISHDEICRNNFNKIRSSITQNSKTHLVGIDLSISKYVSYDFIEEIIRNLISQTNFSPVLLKNKNGTQLEDQIVHLLNSKFNNSLLTIKSDKKALISVLSNLDLVISSDQFSIALCDMSDTPTVQVCRTLKNIKQYSLYSNYIYCADQASNEASLEICDVCNNVLNGHRIEDISGLYKIKTGKLGRYPSGITEFEQTKMLVKRIYLNTLHSGDKVNSKSIKLESDSIKKITESEKEAILEISRTILSSIRLLKAKINSKTSSEQFISNIEKILSYAKTDHILSVACKMFQNEINSLPKSNAKANTIIAEKILFHLKNDLKVLNNIIDELSEESVSINYTQPQI